MITIGPNVLYSTVYGLSYLAQKLLINMVCSSVIASASKDSLSLMLCNQDGLMSQLCAWGYFLAYIFRNHMNCLKLSGHMVHDLTTGSTWKRSISQVFLSLDRVDMSWCEYLVSFFLQMKEMPIETIMTVQMPSENKTQSLCSTEHKKQSILQVSLLLERLQTAQYVFWGDFPLQRQKCL